MPPSHAWWATVLSRLNLSSNRLALSDVHDPLLISSGVDGRIKVILGCGEVDAICGISIHIQFDSNITRIK